MIIFSDIFKSILKKGSHAGLDIVLNNTLGSLVTRTPIKSDDHLFNYGLKPALHDLIEHAFNRFKGVNISDYFKTFWLRCLNYAVDVNILKVMRDDLNARISVLDGDVPYVIKDEAEKSNVK
jgi:hypothetical protein